MFIQDAISYNGLLSHSKNNAKNVEFNRKVESYSNLNLESSI
jgi:hypothetical protein